MHIIQMLGILSAVFFVSLLLMCLFHDKLGSPVLNYMFVCSCALFFFFWNYSMYEHRAGDVNGFMVLENISPFISAVISITPILHPKVKDFAYSAIAFLGFGMFVAMFISPEVEFFYNFHQDAKFIHVSEAICHLIMGLYGFYLVLSDKVKLNLKSYARALVFIYSAIGLGVFLNLCFHQSNFGMDMYGNYSIYFLDIFDSFAATLVAYLFGVLATITVGFVICVLIDWLCRRPKRIHQKKDAE